MTDKFSRLNNLGTFIGALAATVAAIASVKSVNRMSEQNHQIQEQNTKISEQIRMQREQNTQQQGDSLAARRLQAIFSLYESTEPSGKGTTPRADQRTRAEAAKYFVDLERNRLNKSSCETTATPSENCVILTKALLQNADLSKVDFSRVILSSAKFQDSELPDAVLSHAFLDGADFTLAKLKSTDLSYADLQKAILVNTTLHGTNFQCADLRGANFSGAIITQSGAEQIKIKGANITGIQNAPVGFIYWAKGAGAYEGSSDVEWHQLCPDNDKR